MTVTEATSSAERWKRTAVKAWALIGVLVLLVAVGWVLRAVSSALVPFGIGLLVVLMLRRAVDRLATRMPRIAAVGLCYLTGFVAVGIALTFIVPPVYAQVSQFAQALPGYVQQAFKLWDGLVLHPTRGSGIPGWLQTVVLSLKDQVLAGAGTWSSALATNALSAGGSIASGVIGFVLSLIIGFFALVDLPRITTEIYALAGPKWRDEIRHGSTTLTRVMGGWLRGTLIQSAVVAVLISLGLWAAGVPYALALGVIGGILNIVPYLGPVLTALLAAAAGLFVSVPAALWAVAVVFAVQQIDSLITAPRIMSEQVDLHPLLVIFSLLVGASLFGVWGMVLSVPVAAFVKGMFVFMYEKRTERQITSDDGVLFPTAKEDLSDAASQD